MATTPVENKTNIPKHIAGVTIPPGEVRFFDESDLPPYMRKAKQRATASDNEQGGNDLVDHAAADITAQLTELLDNSVKNIDKQLHTLPLGQLDQLDVMEQAAGNRSTLLQSITNERLRRADIENDIDLTSVEKYVRVHRVG